MIQQKCPWVVHNPSIHTPIKIPNFGHHIGQESACKLNSQKKYWGKYNIERDQIGTLIAITLMMVTPLAINFLWTYAIIVLILSIENCEIISKIWLCLFEFIAFFFGLKPWGRHCSIPGLIDFNFLHHRYE